MSVRCPPHRAAFPLFCRRCHMRRQAWHSGRRENDLLGARFHFLTRRERESRPAGIRSRHGSQVHSRGQTVNNTGCCSPHAAPPSLIQCTGSDGRFIGAPAAAKWETDPTMSGPASHTWAPGSAPRRAAGSRLKRIGAGSGARFRWEALPASPPTFGVAVPWQRRPFGAIPPSGYAGGPFAGLGVGGPPVHRFHHGGVGAGSS